MCRGRGQADVELVLDAIRSEELAVDLEPVELCPRDEVGELARGEVKSAVLVDADRVLVPQPPEGALNVDRRRCVHLSRAGATLVKQHALMGAVELAVVDGVAADELAKGVEQLRRERVGTAHTLGFAEEVQRLPEVTRRKPGHGLPPRICRSSYGHKRHESPPST